MRWFRISYCQQHVMNICCCLRLKSKQLFNLEHQTNIYSKPGPKARVRTRSVHNPRSASKRSALVYIYIYTDFVPVSVDVGTKFVPTSKLILFCRDGKWVHIWRDHNGSISEEIKMIPFPIANRYKMAPYLKTS